MSKKKHNQFKRVLIANRGEIAVRIARTLREMDIEPVAVYSDADRIAPHVRNADMAFHIGPPAANESYLRTDRILDIAKRYNIDAIHPGYGFLSENAAFAETITDAGITFIGPPPNAIRVMGSKTAARDAMKSAGVPCVPGSEGPVKSLEEATQQADEMGFPVMLKASAGGGGKGMRLVGSKDEMSSAFRAATSEARNAFGDDTVYIEKAIIEPRHVEIQILSGPDGRAIWLGERECSMQRRHQKVIEETPSTAISEEVRRRMGEVACKAAEAVDYVGAGTVEFLVDRDENFYFLEMNTRLQVEHAITEACCGIDLVEAQVNIAQGKPMPWRQDDIVRQGHAIEARIYAEDPERDFMPCPGHIDELILPQGPGVRVDCGVAAGFEVPRYYDPMIAKVVTWAEDRERARRRMSRALSEMAVKGVTTNTAFLRRLLELDAFKKGDYHTGTIDSFMRAETAPPAQELVDVAIAASVVYRYRRDKNAARQAATAPTQGTAGWRGTASWRWRNG